MESTIPERFTIDAQPLAAPEAIVIQDCARFSILTPRLMRIEYGPNGVFEDRASQAFWYRRQPVPRFEVSRKGNQVEIRTQALALRYHPFGQGFSPASLSIELLNENVTWRYGERDLSNLFGTLRTLDNADGAQKLEKGLLSRAGWSVVDDSNSLVFDDKSWLQPRSQEALDLYFFGYGNDFQGCLRDWFKVAGQVPLVPRWILGNWWSRYWEYTQHDIQELMTEFKRREVPLSICIIDMDWHTVKTGNACSGWTGYTWNRELFPDPPQLIRWLHSHGLRTALNLHPAEGIHPHEQQYRQLALYLGLDPDLQDPIVFDPTNPQFIRGYFDILHHPYEKDGVDFWWLDWQQGTQSKVHGLDPLWWLNHLHFYDQQHRTQRPFIFSRWGGLGNHRYPIGFSGDTVVSWASLAFQPYFTATASNVGYSWWSHDIGGHQWGTEDRELYTRWVQFGVFSPIFRLHSTKNVFLDRRPWAFGDDVFHIVRDAMQLRHALIPYIYSMAWRTTAEGIPLVRPMYYLHPEKEAAYDCPNEYYFGSELVVVPFTSPHDPDTGLSRTSVWLPPGDWFHWTTGEYFAGDQWITFHGKLEDTPVFARAGAIIPLGPKVSWGGIDAPKELRLELFPGADNGFDLYEDDGETTAYLQGRSARTVFRHKWQPNRWEFDVDPVQGETALIPQRRTYTLVFHGIFRPEKTTILLNGTPIQAAGEYEMGSECLTLRGITIGAADRLGITLESESLSLMSRRDRTDETCLEMLSRFKLKSNIKERIANEITQIVQDPSLLNRFVPALAGAQSDALNQVIKRRRTIPF